MVWVTSGQAWPTRSGLLDAHSDGTIPIVCISGQVATPVIGTDAFQECDALGLSRPVTKWNHQGARPEEVWRAVEILRGLPVGRPGPVLDRCPRTQLALHARLASRRACRTSSTGSHRGPWLLLPPMAASGPAAALYVGRWVLGAGEARAWPEGRRRVDRRLGASTLMGLGAMPGAHQHLGTAGMHGLVEANLAMHHADGDRAWRAF